MGLKDNDGVAEEELEEEWEWKVNGENGGRGNWIVSQGPEAFLNLQVLFQKLLWEYVSVWRLVYLIHFQLYQQDEHGTFFFR